MTLSKVAKGIPVLAYCRSATDVEILVKYRADVTQLSKDLQEGLSSTTGGAQDSVWSSQMTFQVLKCLKAQSGSRTPETQCGDP